MPPLSLNISDQSVHERTLGRLASLYFFNATLTMSLFMGISSIVIV